MAGAQVVYGSTGSLYVASQRYVRALELGTDVPEGMRTEIHRFDVSDPTKTVYKASGSVPGFILNNYALSEHNGDLRVASTEQPPWVPGGAAPTSSSRVTVLRQDGAKLNQIGAVGGLGEGERIYAVRFMGERGYVVTFRQVDPLYTLDLTDPTAPKVVGELKIPGYSAYLHPVGENLLLGIGREGPNVKASLFDVANMAAPREVTNLSSPPARPRRERTARLPLLGAEEARRHAAAVLHRERRLRGRGRRARGAERAHRGRPDRPPRRRPRGERAGRALAGDRRQALLAVVPRPVDQQHRQPRNAGLHGVLKRGAAAAGGEGVPAAAAIEGRGMG